MWKRAKISLLSHTHVLGWLSKLYKRKINKIASKEQIVCHFMVFNQNSKPTTTFEIKSPQRMYAWSPASIENIMSQLILKPSNIQLSEIKVLKWSKCIFSSIYWDYDKVRLLKDSTVKLAVKAGIEFIFRTNMSTCNDVNGIPMSHPLRRSSNVNTND